MIEPLAIARQVLRIEGGALLRLEQSIGQEVADAVALIVHCNGRVVVTGMGKAGLVGRKIAATMASTGVPAFFLHPAEAAHGDLGQVVRGDLLLALSNSGRTAEVLCLMPALQAAQIQIIAITAQSDSPLGRGADICIPMGDLDEACPIGLAPTTSSTVMLALGDALAMAAAAQKGTSREDFARNHPGGNLGRALTSVAELMRRDEYMPFLRLPATLRDAVRVMTDTPGRPGCAVVVDDQGGLLGIFTDGDLRRLVADEAVDLNAAIETLMSRGAMSVRSDDRAIDAEAVMVTRSIDQVPVLDETGRAVGLIDIQDLHLSGRSD
jgi:arabinose-5-phosphate isomerase